MCHDFSRLVVSIEVSSEDQGDSVESTLFDHGDGSSALFFRGLKQDTDRCGELSFLCEQFRRSEDHRHMSVVAASMHDAFVLRSELQAGLLLDR